MSSQQNCSNSLNTKKCFINFLCPVPQEIFPRFLPQIKCIVQKYSFTQLQFMKQIQTKILATVSPENA